MASENFYHFSPAGKVCKLASRDEAAKTLFQKGYVWIDIEKPDREIMEFWKSPLKLFPMSIDDCLDENHVPKVNDFPDYSFILFVQEIYKDKSIQINEVDFFIGKNFLLSVHSLEIQTGFFENASRESLFQNPIVFDGPDFLLHLLLDGIIDEKIIVIDKIEEELEKIEEEVLKPQGKSQPVELMQLRRNIISLRKCVFHEREILVKLCRRDSQFLREKTIYYFRELYDHLTKLFETIEINREMVTSIMEIYLSQISIRISHSANQTNLVMKRLTVLMTIFSPLAIITGFFGMSEWTMMIGADNWKTGFMFLFLAMCLFGTLNYFFLKRFRWT
ncbi:MAG: magnesium transporter CorA family protein [Candidatus Riflebacteria bacterium]|nr:magnesium transporter CorA family protein [Candidatus Riflebacteria bacterium]